MTILEKGRELLHNAMAFFIEEELQWNDEKRCFDICKTAPNNERTKVGEINRENFDNVRDMMLQLNYIGIGKEAAPVQHSSS